MFVAGMCTISYIADNNLFGSQHLYSWACFFGAVVLATGLFHIYHLHRWFKYCASDREAQKFVFLILLKLCILITLTEYFNIFLAKASINYSVRALNTFRFYAIIGTFLLSTYIKLFKEKYLIKSSSEFDHLV